MLQPQQWTVSASANSLPDSVSRREDRRLKSLSTSRPD
jgi:hypothetical protein